MYISNIRLKNIRGFKDEGLSFFNKINKPRMCNLLIGMNGTCKTTFLRCIAIGLSGEGAANGLLQESFGSLISNNPGFIEIELTNETSKKRKVIVKTKIFSSKIKGEEIATRDIPDGFFDGLIAGYGIGVSSTGKEEFRHYRIIDSTYSLFDYQTTIAGPELIIRRLHDYLGIEKYEKLEKNILRSIGAPSGTKFSLPKGGGIVIFDPFSGKNIPLEGWADGYRITLSWIFDFYAWAMRSDSIDQNGEVYGILLIDEVDKHLHPSLQINIMKGLNELWPKVQMFCTTHSPMVALGAESGDLIVLRRKGKFVTVHDNPPDYSNYSIEDLIGDRNLFNSNIYSPRLHELIEENKKLYLKENLTIKEKKRKNQLSKLLSDYFLPDHENIELKNNFDNLKNELSL